MFIISTDNSGNDKKNFIAAGRKNPRIGGVILSGVKDKTELIKIINEDPFIINNILKYEITEFDVAMVQDGYEILLENNK